MRVMMMDEEVVKFWKAFEAESGETVEAKAVGEVFDRDAEAGVWVLLVLTDKSFWFKQVPSENWMASMFRARSLLSSSRPPEESTLSIPRGDLAGLTEPERAPRGWFSKPAFPRFTLSWREGGAMRSRCFSVDPSAELLPRLRALFKG